MELDEIKEAYRKLDLKILMLIAVPLTIFGFAYLNTQSANFSLNLPELSQFWEYLGLAMVISILLTQFFQFKKRISEIRILEIDLRLKIKLYAQATMMRYWGYFFCGLICSAGLMFFQNQGFTALYTVTLMLLSFSKPTPDRIIGLLKFEGEEREMILRLKKRE